MSDQKELARQRLAGLLEQAAGVSDLLGVQSQFLRCSRWAAQLRGADLAGDADRYFRAWTLRGTMHIHAVEDYGLYMHQGSRSPYIRDYWADHTLLSAAEKERAADRMLSLIQSGTAVRKAIVDAFRADMPDAAVDYLFNPWGGLPRVLMERGQIVQTIAEELSYRLAPDITPLPAEEAEREQMRRYLMGYAPCGVEDAAYFFRCGKGKCKRLMDACVQASKGRLAWEGGLVRRLDRAPAGGDSVYVLPSFDPLLVGYEKKMNPMIPPEHLRTVYTLQGIIRPVIVVEGRCIAVWTVRKGSVCVTPFAAPDSSPVWPQAEQQLRSLTGCTHIIYE